jgi:hypothetical protein
LEFTEIFLPAEYIKIKNGHVKMPAMTGINGVPGHWYCFKNKTAKKSK